MIALAAILAFAVCAAATPIARVVAVKLKIYDLPGAAKIHSKPMPYLGGIAIFAGFLAAMAGIPEHSSQSQAIAIIIGAFVMLAAGLLDDLRRIPAIYKLGFELLMVALLLYAGLNISLFQNKVADIALLALWVVFITNAFNNIDGLDGLAAGIAVICSLFFAVIYTFMGSPLAVALSLALAGSCLAFLIYNFSPASIFMGDAGSLFIGFVLAVIPLVGFVRTGSALAAVSIPVLVLGVLVIDSSFVLIRRAAKGQHPLTGDLGHTYNLIHNRLRSTTAAVFLMYLACVILGVLSLVLVYIV